jgi:hypothetical protein
VAAAVVAGHAAEPGVAPQASSFTLSLVSPPPQPVVFWQRFDFAFDNNVNGVFADALQPLNAVRWNVDLRGRDFSDNFRERASSRARGAFIRSLEYGGREAILAIPLMLWLDENQSWFAKLLRGSIGNVNEEIAAPLDISHEGLQQSWWRAEASQGTDYGIRPFRTSPYAYVSHGITEGDRIILLAHIRYYYDRFAHHRMELGFSVPLEYGIMLDCGNSYEFASHDAQHIAIKLVKELRGGGMARVGFEVRQHPALIAGITFGW